MNRCSKSGIREHSPNSQIHVQIFHRVARLSSIDFPDHGEDGFHKMGCVWRYLEIVFPCRFCIFLTLLINWRTGPVCKGLPPSFYCFGQRVFPVTCFPLKYQISASGLSESSESSSWCDGFPRCFAINPPRYASLSRTWDVDAASNEFGLTLTLLSGFPEAIGITGLLDAIGLDAVEELVAMEEDRFIAAGRDLDTTRSSSSCSCIFFAIVKQLLKLKFLVQQVELKWLVLNKGRRSFHSSRAKFPLVKMSASWCLVSM